MWSKRAIYDGLSMAWDVQWRDVIVEPDCVLAIEGINGGAIGILYRDLVIKINELCHRDWRVVFKQIPREMNFTAHSFVSLLK